jgi:hypothetical protein
VKPPLPPRDSEFPASLHLAGHPIELGECREIALHFGETYLGEPVSVPVYVLRGPKPGPTVYLTGTIHGDELNGMGIIRQLLFVSPPELVRGTLICLPVVNTYGLEHHVRYMPDRRDLNRCFPGIVDGSLSSRLASVVFSKIVKQCHYGIDFHAAAVRRMNYPNVRADLTDPATRELATVFGCELIVGGQGPEGSLRRSAVAAGVPTIILEAGEVWRIDPAATAVGVQGCLNVLRHLKMIQGRPKRPKVQALIDRTVWVRAHQGGMFEPRVQPGDIVHRGTTLGTAYRIFSSECQQLDSPVSGVVLGMNTMGAVKPGEPVFHIAVLPPRTCASFAARKSLRNNSQP